MEEENYVETYRCGECSHEFESNSWPETCPSCKHHHCGDDNCCAGNTFECFVKEEKTTEPIQPKARVELLKLRGLATPGPYRLELHETVLPGRRSPPDHWRLIGQDVIESRREFDKGRPEPHSARLPYWCIVLSSYEDANFVARNYNALPGYEAALALAERALHAIICNPHRHGAQTALAKEALKKLGWRE